MQSTNRIGLIAAGISGLVVLLIFGAIVGVRAFLDSIQPSPTEQPTPAVAQPSPTGTPADTSSNDSDGDGLADDIEPLYRTDPNNPDTDGDGTNDGDELSVLRDPTKPGPDDTLQALTDSGHLDQNTYTGRYLALLPSNASRQDILSRDKIEAFIDQERGDLLPSIDLSTIPASDGSGKEAISAYLDSISATQNTKLAVVTSDDITRAFRDSSSTSGAQSLAMISNQLDSNLTLLKSVKTPAETLELQQKLLEASQSLRDNVKLLENMRNDFIGGLVGAKNIEDLGPVFQDIAKQITTLENKYNLD